MKQTTLWAAIIITCLIAVLTATSTSAAPPQQDATPTETATRVRPIGPTWTPTPTMLPLPIGGGRVAVQAAAVRIEPFPNSPAVGSLEYNAEVHPIGRSRRGVWVAVNWQNQQVGWILAELIVWHPDFDYDALAVFLPPYDDDLVTTRPTSVPATNTVSPSDTPEPNPTDTLTPAPTETATLMATASETVVAEVVVGGEVPTDEPTSPDSDPVVLPPLVPVLPYVGIGVPIILLGLYGWQFAKGEREVRRYANIFPLANCPVCQWGALSLDESIQRPLGIARVTRTVRCDTCRSVLRQVDSGEWRYAIDPLINPQLAAEFDGKTFSDERLREFAMNASAYPPITPESDVPPPLTDEEILADLEARIPPPEEVTEETPEEAPVDRELPTEGDVVEAPPEDQSPAS